MEYKTIVEVKAGITTITAKAEINATPERVWETLRFPGEIARFHPLIKASRMTSATPAGLHAKRHCELLPMGEMEEVVTEWKEKEGFTMEVVGGKMLPPYLLMIGRVSMKKREEKTEVSFQFSYQLKFGFVGRVLDQLLIRSQFKKAPPQYVLGLKAYVEQKSN
ncbi:MAG: SRPBCC family protein [Saprospiraceae bacterium]|nr:SRPBCC family protein [Saprospiraceae bacterium]